jgi:hypothetical protein
VTIDLGDWNDIHPLNKKDVGIRLAKAAGFLAYNDNRPAYTGPLFKSMEIQNDNNYFIRSGWRGVKGKVWRNTPRICYSRKR